MCKFHTGNYHEQEKSTFWKIPQNKINVEFAHFSKNKEEKKVKKSEEKKTRKIKGDFY